MIKLKRKSNNEKIEDINILVLFAGQNLGLSMTCFLTGIIFDQCICFLIFCNVYK